MRVVKARSAVEVMEVIPRLLEEHDGCERVSAIAGDNFLFSVDCEGNRMSRDKP
ncbi:MAG: hypothetical protein Q7T61_18660 [Caulobacter sp.]|nr:hypothetical protein [Caulobacter sp.]